MTRAFQALTAEPWAIEPSWLPLIASLALREQPAAHPEPTWAEHSLDLFAGPNGRRMEGSQRAVVTADGVALIPVFGPIFPRANMMTEISGATTAQGLQADYQLALDHPDVGAVLFLGDTPGGQVSGIASLSDAIHAGRKRKLTAMHVVGNLASAGYWVGSQVTAGNLTIDRTSALGSIGVLAGLRKQVQPDAAGQMAFDIVSSNAPNKRVDPEAEEGVAELVSMLDAIEGQFVADVARGRGVSAAKVKADFGQGGVKVGQAAVDAGMADRVAPFEAVYRDIAKQVANQRKVKSLKA